MRLPRVEGAREVVTGHVAYFTFAVLDVPKDQEKGNDTHGSKVIVVPFDGVAFDRDMENRSKAERRNGN